MFLLFPCYCFSLFKISHLNALLQFYDGHSNKIPHFIISAEGSCVTWTSMNPSIVKVVPNYDSQMCSKSAYVEVVATGPNRKATSIIAEAQNGVILRCDVYVDSIVNVSILTTTRSIYVDSSFETLSVQAFDSENNIFTSLEGLDINWEIDNQHLKKIPIDDARVVLNGMNRNKQTSLIIQGTKVGKTCATVKLNNKLSAKVPLVVVEPIALFPSPIIRVLPFSHIPFKLCSTRGIVDHDSELRCISQIELPSKQYILSSSDNSILKVDKNGYVSTHELGMASIIATDKAVPDNIASTLVNVAYPSRVEQEIQYIALGDDPVFDPVLYLSDGNKLDTFEPIHWDIKGDWSSIGRKEIILSYHDFSFKAIVVVCPPIIIEPKQVVLPIGYSSYPLYITGGSGDYNIEVDDPTIINLVNSEIKTFKQGITKINVYDKKIKRYYTFSTVTVNSVEHIDIVLEKRELLIGSTFEPKCEVYAKGNNKFSVQIPTQIISEQPEIVSSKMVALKPGFSNIFCRTNGKNSEIIKVGVADYLNVNITGKTSPGSITPIMYSGGLQSWINSPPPSFEIKCSNANITMINSNKFIIDKEYNGDCEAIMQNSKTKYNPFPLKLVQKFHLDCSNVEKLKIHVIDENASTRKECNAPPRKITSDVSNLYKVIEGNLHKIYVEALDKFGNIINYYSSTEFELKSSNNEILKPLDELNGETIYHYIPKDNVELSIISPYLKETQNVSLKLISKFNIERSKIIYYTPNSNCTFNIEGNYGFLSTNSPNAIIKENALTVYPKSPGISYYSLTDICTNDNPVNVQVKAISVHALQIIVQNSAPVNTDIHIVVNAYDSDGVLIPKTFLEFADIKVSPLDAIKIGIDTWKIKSTKTGPLTITARASNGVNAKKTINILKSLYISPQYVTLLPGETQRLSVVEGEPNVVFDFGNGNIARVIDFDIIGVNPGKTIINASVRGIDSMKPFPIYVNVLKPIELILTPSSKQIIQNGLLYLNLIVTTDEGDRIPHNTKWEVSKGFPYFQLNSSSIIVNCTLSKELKVKVEAFNTLKAFYSAEIEPNLILTSPSQLPFGQILLPPLCSYQIKVQNSLDFQCFSQDESIITCNNDIIKSGTKEGETVVNVRYGHQFLSISVRVTKPSFLYIDYQIQYSRIQMILLDPYGLKYSSIKGVSFELSGISEFKHSNFDSLGYCNVSFPSSDLIEINGIAYNNDFQIRKSYYLYMKQKIIPENAFIQKGNTLEYYCSSTQQKWSVSDKSIVQISKNGIIKAINEGKSIVSCSKSINTIVNVVEMKDIQIYHNIQNQYQIKPIFSNNIQYSDVKTFEDLSLICESNYPHYGKFQSIHNSTGFFCIFEPDLNNDNYPQNANLKVTFRSNTGKFSLSSTYPMTESKSNTNFGFANGIIIRFSETKRKVEIPFNIPQSDIIYNAPKGLTLSFTRNSIIIKADDPVNTDGFIVIKHKITGEFRKIEVLSEENSEREGLFSFGNHQDLIFYVCIISLFACIWYIIYVITSPK